MHIPDGFLNTPVIVTTYTLSSGYLIYFWQKVKKQFNEQSVPKIALLAAFIFVAQMINIPISEGTSGHLLGGFLAASLLGPFASVFLISLVLVVQMFVFQDGGLTALGANILNMGIAGVCGSYLFFKIISKLEVQFFQKNQLILFNIFMSAWLSVEIGAILCGIELGLSGFADWKIVVGLMSGVHAIIGVLEGILTVFIYQAIRHIRPDLIYINQKG